MLFATLYCRYSLFFSRLTTKQVLDLLFEEDFTSADIAIAPPEDVNVRAESDQDSDDENGANADRLNGNQLRSHAILRVLRNGKQTVYGDPEDSPSESQSDDSCNDEPAQERVSRPRTKAPRKRNERTREDPRKRRRREDAEHIATDQPDEHEDQQGSEDENGHNRVIENQVNERCRANHFQQRRWRKVDLSQGDGSLLGVAFQSMPEDAEFRTTLRSPVDFFELWDKNGHLIVVQWNDNSVVSLVSNAEPIRPVKNAHRWSKQANARINVEQPKIVATYNQHMGGTDRMDQNVASYPACIRSKKRWWPLFIYGLDVAMQNAWLLYRTSEAEQVPRDLLSFRRYVVQTYITKYSTPAGVVRPIASARDTRVEHDVRFDNIGHMVISVEGRPRCAVCNSRPKTMCVKCNVGLCPKCFVSFHTK